MKWIKALVLLLAGLIGGLWIGYDTGFRDRPPLSAKEALLIQLSLDGSDYNALKDGKTGLVEESLRVRIWGEMKAYDLYKKEDPTYNTKNEGLKLWVEKTRIIAQEEQKQIDAAVEKSK